MIKCLLCSRNIAQNFLFIELFLLKNPQNLLCSKCQKNFEKIPEAHCPRCCKQTSMRSVLIVKIGKKEDTKSDIRQFFTTIKQ